MYHFQSGSLQWGFAKKKFFCHGKPKRQPQPKPWPSLQAHQRQRSGHPSGKTHFFFRNASNWNSSWSSRSSTRSYSCWSPSVDASMKQLWSPQCSRFHVAGLNWHKPGWNPKQQYRLTPPLTHCLLSWQIDLDRKNTRLQALWTERGIRFCRENWNIGTKCLLWFNVAQYMEPENTQEINEIQILSDLTTYSFVTNSLDHPV